jgi:cystathionine gamma-synthase
MNATTKYLGGHSDILGGTLTFKNQSETSEFIRDYQKYGGAVPSPYDCWLLCRSLNTFAVRMPLHASNAQKLAEYLNQHSLVEKVLYPGLSSDPYHQIASNQMIGGYGGMLSILVKGQQKEALKVTQKLKLFKHATSLGGVESLIEHRNSVEGVHSHSPENLLRISVGLEYIDDLINDFEQALS